MLSRPFRVFSPDVSLRWKNKHYSLYLALLRSTWPQCWMVGCWCNNNVSGRTRALNANCRNRNQCVWTRERGGTQMSVGSSTRKFCFVLKSRCEEIRCILNLLTLFWHFVNTAAKWRVYFSACSKLKQKCRTLRSISTNWAAFMSATPSMWGGTQLLRHSWRARCGHSLTWSQVSDSTPLLIVVTQNKAVWKLSFSSNCS